MGIERVEQLPALRRIPVKLHALVVQGVVAEAYGLAQDLVGIEDLAIALAGGVLLWLFGRGVNHIGASGLVFGLAGYLIASGCLGRLAMQIIGQAEYDQIEFVHLQHFAVVGEVMRDLAFRGEFADVLFGRRRDRDDFRRRDAPQRLGGTVRQVVDHYDVAARLEEFQGRMTSDETGAAGDEHACCHGLMVPATSPKSRPNLAAPRSERLAGSSFARLGPIASLTK